MIINSEYHLKLYDKLADLSDVNKINAMIIVGLGHILWRIAKEKDLEPYQKNDLMRSLFVLCAQSGGELIGNATKAEDIQHNCKVLYKKSFDKSAALIAQDSLNNPRAVKLIWKYLQEFLKERAEVKSAFNEKHRKINSAYSKYQKVFTWDGKIRTILANLNQADLAFWFNVDYAGKDKGRDPKLSDNAKLELNGEAVPKGSQLAEGQHADWHILNSEKK